MKSHIPAGSQMCVSASRTKAMAPVYSGLDAAYNRPVSERVTFFSQGLQLVGYLHRPDGAELEKRAGIVACTGFGSTQAGALQERARELAKHGFVVLTLDYRGFGESDGPHNRMI